MTDQIDKLVRALEAIRNVADYHREHNEWPEAVLVHDMQFDDWAGEVAASALAGDYGELDALTERVPPWEYDTTVGHFRKQA